MMKLGIVCGYGNILDENLRIYINSVVDCAMQQNLSSLILSGGYTYNDKISEARLMAQLVSDRTHTIHLVLEEKALTTLHNLLYSKEILQNLNEPVEELYIFCDRIRFAKVYWLSRLIFSGQSVKIIKFSGKKENLLVYLMQIPSALFQGLGVVFPRIEKQILINKQKWFDKYR